MSFDVLGRWVEDGTPPEASFRGFLAHAVARIGLALIWLYLGLVPKLLVSHPEEQAPFLRAGFSDEAAGKAVVVLGVAEVAVGIALLTQWQSSWLPYLAGLLPLVLTTGAVLSEPSVASGPYNPVVTTVGTVSLGIVAGYLAGDVPTAANCTRTPLEQ